MRRGWMRYLVEIWIVYVGICTETEWDWLQALPGMQLSSFVLNENEGEPSKTWYGSPSHEWTTTKTSLTKNSWFLAKVSPIRIPSIMTIAIPFFYPKIYLNKFQTNKLPHTKYHLPFVYPCDVICSKYNARVLMVLL